MNRQNPIMMIQQFQKFRNEFKGNPQQEVERLVREGRISQQQLNQELPAEYVFSFKVQSSDIQILNEDLSELRL